MKYLIAIIALLVASAASAETVARCVIPTAAESAFSVMCEEFRTAHRIAEDDWNIGKCASEFMRRYARQYRQALAKQAAEATRDATIRTLVQALDDQISENFTRTTCGDGVLQMEYDEFCDDGNKVAGDGCDLDCLIE